MIPSQSLSEERRTLVVDTCVLLADPEALYGFGAAEVVLPLTVIEELDNQKSRLDEVGRAARQTVRLIEELRVMGGGDLQNPVSLPKGGTLRIAVATGRITQQRGLAADKNDNEILAVALGLQEGGRPVTVVSSDGAMRIKAAYFGLVAEDYRPLRAGRHTTQNPGWSTLEVSGHVIDLLYRHKAVELHELGNDREAIEALPLNEFVILKDGQQSGLARRTLTGLRHHDRQQEAWGLRPKSKEQSFALELLQDPEVPIVGLSGAAGTGKTILALAAGLEQVFERDATYERMMILRPVVAVGRQELGFLPGDKDEKLGPWMEAIIDAMVALSDGMTYAKAKDQVALWVQTERLTLEAVTYLRGRSLQRTYILVDEAQNLEPSTLKTILTRLGQGSKVVLVGDTSQIDNPYISERTNALSVLADTFAGQDLFGHLVLTKGERSAVADLAAHLL